MDKQRLELYTNYLISNCGYVTGLSAMVDDIAIAMLNLADTKTEQTSMQYQATANDGFGMRYSTCNEDNCVELEFLNLNRDATIFCITGSTGRVLNLLTARQGPKRIFAVDANPAQNFLLELKMSAVRRFNYSQYVEFLGLRPCRDRRLLFEQICGDLTQECCSFWRKHLTRIKRGVLFQGRFERFYRMNHAAIKLFFNSALKKLKHCKTIEDQRRLYREEWDGLLWRFLLAIHSSDWMYKRLLNDPIFFDPYHELGGKRLARINYIERISESMATKTLIRENPMFSLLLCGNYDYVATEFLPPNLREEQFEKLKSRVDCIEIVNATTEEFFKERPAQSIDSFSLADIGNCMSPLAYERLIEDVIRVGKPGARFVLRHSYGERTIQRREHRQKIRCFEDVQEKMRKLEHTFAYTFTLGEVLHKELQ